ncbi:MAG: MFS transporter [Actinobacteria bacterium]|nr:MFS transporter [Actinomycetota bacterium]
MDRTCPTAEPFRHVAGSVVFVTLLFFLTFLGRFIFSPLMPVIGEDIGVTASQAGSVFLLGSLGGLLGSLAAGRISTRFDHRGAFLTSMFGMAIVLVVSAMAGSVWSLGAAFFALGVLAGINQPSVVATITAMVQRRDWGKALSVQQAAPPLGLVAAPLVAVVLLAFVSWRVSLIAVGVFVALVGVALLRFRGLAQFPGDPPRLRLVGPILRARSFWLMIGLMALGMGAQVGVYTMLPLFLTQEKLMTTAGANALLGVANLPPLAVVFAAGWVTDRVGERWAMFGALVLTGAATVLVGASDGVWLRVGIFLLPAFAVCFFPPAFSALSRIVQPNLRSVVAALAPPVAFILGGGLLPLGLGYMGENHTFAQGIVVAGTVMVVGSGLAFFVRLLREDEMEEGC